MREGAGLFALGSGDGFLEVYSEDDVSSAIASVAPPQQLELEDAGEVSGRALGWDGDRIGETPTGFPKDERVIRGFPICL